MMDHAQQANQIQGFRILDRWEAGEKNNTQYLVQQIFNESYVLRYQLNCKWSEDFQKYQLLVQVCIIVY